MIAEHFGWTTDPFDRDIPVDSLVSFHAHSEVTARLLFAAEHRQLALVTGDTGMGKTTAVRAAMHRLDSARYRPIYVASAGLTSQTLLRILLERLHIEPRFRYSDNHALVQAALEDSHASGQQVVFVIDEAHDLNPLLLGQLRYLLNFRTDSFSPLSLWLVGQTELRETLRLRVLTPLSQRIEMRYAMTPMTVEELSFYMKEQLLRVGEERMVFAADAVAQIAKLSKGVPRVVNSICKAALLNVTMQGEQVVGVTNVESAWLEVNG